MAKTKKKPEASGSDSGEVRSIRFTTSQFQVIQKAATARDLEFATFVRQAALVAAGVGRDEIGRVKALAKSLASVGRA